MKVTVYTENGSEKVVDYGLRGWWQFTFTTETEEEEELLDDIEELQKTRKENEYTFLIYGGDSLSEVFNLEDLEPYRDYGLDCETFFSDFREGIQDEEDLPCITDTKYGLDIERYLAAVQLDIFEKVFGLFEDKDESIKKALLECFFEVIREEYI